MKNIVDELNSRGLRIAVAESCTGGLIANLITNCPGSSNCFETGIVAYSNATKARVLGVSQDTLEKYGAVSAEVALEMSKCICNLSGADIGISSTGYAEEGRGIFLSLFSHNLHTQKKYIFNGTRVEIKTKAAQTAIELVLDFVTKM